MVRSLLPVKNRQQAPDRYIFDVIALFPIVWILLILILIL